MKRFSSVTIILFSIICSFSSAQVTKEALRDSSITQRQIPTIFFKGNMGTVTVYSDTAQSKIDFLTYKFKLLYVESCLFNWGVTFRTTEGQVKFQQNNVNGRFEFFEGSTWLSAWRCHFEGEMFLDCNHVKNINLYENTYKRLTLRTQSMDGKINISGLISDTLEIRAKYLTDSARIDINGLSSADRIRHPRIPLVIDSILAKSIVIDFKKFYLAFSSRAMGDEKARMYQILLARYAKSDTTVSAKELNQDYRHFYSDNSFYRHYLADILDMWEDYGTNLRVMVYFSLFVYMLFVIINIFLYQYLNANIYLVKNLNANYKPARHYEKFFFHCFNSLIYTGLIFISPWLKIENFTFDARRFLGVAWVFITYFTGLWLLYYIIHYLLKG